jgi:hypothetical protein
MKKHSLIIITIILLLTLTACSEEKNKITVNIDELPPQKTMDVPIEEWTGLDAEDTPKDGQY